MLFLAALSGIQAATAGLVNRQVSPTELIDTQFPHLIIPVSSLEPNKALGTSFQGDIEQSIYTEILFDIPSNTAQWCRLNFHIALDSAPWEFWGDVPFRFNISTVDGTFNKSTDTWYNRPSPVEWIATVEVTHDGKVNFLFGSYGLVSCTKGQPANFLLYPATAAPGGLRWFELTSPLHGITYELHSEAKV
ncbi:hypothetical protein K504DRAFT_391808 [Pleomassaria siparia CBS 279.74]|uniref:Ubiquitin 3 binding protein But2 C-terminal domain-containing protein n=1 Tax=Pleomassaria siparia CBS 279.74 TaxID=1314801 RepID=A0A6G1JSQ6_9PLEO|nr:hypothetical protein K504DRAFT_391808 [Pleomassaria siparia CBS 279.74]